MARLDRTDAFIKGLNLEAYRVGGSVRDELLGRRPKDADYVIFGASLEDVKAAVASAGAKVSKLQLRDGRIVGVRANKRGLGLVEIALPRTEVSTGNSRHEFEIVVDPSLTLEDDAQRRDFTFNALYKVVNSGLIIDPTERGLYDLQHKLITTTHPSSFRDDPLRILRALRFVSTLGYDLCEKTYQEMVEHASAVTGLTQKGVSGTVLEELSKLLMGDDPATALEIARESGVLEVLLPELKPMLGFQQKSRYHDLTVDQHTFKTLNTAAVVNADLRVRLSLLFHDAGKPATAWMGEDQRLHYYAHELNGNREHAEVSEQIAYSVLKRLNAPRRLLQDVTTLVRLHMLNTRGTVKDSDVGRMRVKLGDDLFRDLIMHRACDASGKEKLDQSNFQYLADLEARRVAFIERGIPASIKELKITGYDIKELGVEGPRIGEILSQVLDEVVCQPNEQTMSQEWQIERAKRLARA